MSRRRNLLQRLPDALLKGCAAQVERQLGGALRFFQLADDRLQPVAQPGLIAAQVGGGEARAQLLLQRAFVIAEQQGTDALSLAASSSRPSGQGARA